VAWGEASECLETTWSRDRGHIYAFQFLMLKVLSRCDAASMRLCMGSRRGFIIRMKIGNMVLGSMDSASAASHCMRVRKRSTLGPAADGQQYAVVHVTGYIKNWPPAGLYYTLSVDVCYFRADLPSSSPRLNYPNVTARLSATFY